MEGGAGGQVPSQLDPRLVRQPVADQIHTRDDIGMGQQTVGQLGQLCVPTLISDQINLLEWDRGG